MPQPVSMTSIRTPLGLGLRAGADRDGIFRFARVDGVHEEVDDDLVNPGPAAADRRQRLELGGRVERRVLRA